MYSALGIHKNSRRKLPDELAGTHQKLDKIARSLLAKNLPKKTYFPTAKEILYFEGMRGPDGLKAKSPGEDEPSHFIIPDTSDEHLIDLILDHHYNLHQALQHNNHERAAFEAAWLAHAITDGLTPAHHFPLEDVKKELMKKDELIKIFGQPIKGIMRGDSAWRTLQNNWEYWGVNGYMSRHIAFEYAVALMVNVLPASKLAPKLTKADFQKINLEQEFKDSLEKVYSLRLYERFGDDGLSANLVRDIRHLLLPEIIRLISLAWYSAL